MLLCVSLPITLLLASVSAEPMRNFHIKPRSECICNSTVTSTVPPASTRTCGQVPLFSGKSDRIVNGSLSQRGQFPFIANLLRDYGPAYWPGHFCGGSIYNQNTIITAAHCVDDWTQEDVEKLLIRVGDLGSYEVDAGEVLIKAKRVVLHPNWNSQTMQYDFALIELESPIAYSDYIQPICLPEKSVTGGEKTVVSGWGTTKNTGDSRKLNFVEVPIVSKETCRQGDWYGYSIRDDMICAGFPGGMFDSCQGDSGGPLARVVNGAYELTGVVSWGSGCAEPKKPGVYADTYVAKSWIEENAF